MRSVVAPGAAGTVDRHVDLLPLVRRVGGSKFSSLSRDTRYLAKYFSSELQACFGVDVQSDVASVHTPFTCVVCQRLLAQTSSPDVTVRAVCGVEVVAILRCGSLTLKPAASQCPFPQS